MSVQATSWVWGHSQAEGTARLVLLAIADAANREGEHAWISAKTISKMCRIGHRTAQRKVAELIDSGELEKMGSKGEKHATVYRLPGVRESQSVRQDDVSPVRQDDVRQNGVYAKSDTPLRQTVHAATPPMAHTPINPSITNVIHPNVIDAPHANETAGERPRSMPGRISYSQIFEQFWETYPRKENKPEAWEQWRAASHFNTASMIIAGAARYRDNPHRNPQYTLSPARWLKERRWEDGPAEPPRPQQPDPTYKPGWQKRLEYNAQLNQQYQDPGAEFLRSIEQ